MKDTLTVEEVVEKLSRLDPNMEMVQVDAYAPAMYFNVEDVETLTVQNGKGGTKEVARIVVHRDSVVAPPRY